MTQLQAQPQKPPERTPPHLNALSHLQLLEERVDALTRIVTIVETGEGPATEETRPPRDELVPLARFLQDLPDQLSGIRTRIEQQNARLEELLFVER